MNKRYRYSVGTLETGGFVSFTNLKEAKAEAKDWANESTEEVMVWALGAGGIGDIVDTVTSYPGKLTK